MQSCPSAEVAVWYAVVFDVGVLVVSVGVVFLGVFAALAAGSVVFGGR